MAERHRVKKAPGTIRQILTRSRFDVFVIVAFIAIFFFLIRIQTPVPQPGSRDHFPGNFITPPFKNWEQQLPILNFTVSRLQFSRSEGRRGWLIGAQGAILATANSGKTWQKQQTPVTAFLTDIQMADDNQRGWVVGEAGTILRTTDGGKTWHLQVSDINVTLLAVCFTRDLQHGWITTADGRLLETTDAGATWTLQQTGTDTWLAGIFINRDGSSGWLCGGGGTLLHKADHSADWQLVPQLPRVDFFDLHFSVNGTTGWLAGDDGLLLHTSDNGRTWQQQQTGTRLPLLAVYFLEDNRTGWVLGDDGLLLATRDGGRNWLQQSLPLERQLSSFAYNPETDECWIAGSDGTLFTSRDKGQTWLPATRGGSLLYTGLYFAPDNRTAWALGNDPFVYHSPDRGRSWQQLDPGVDARFRAIRFLADNQTGWVAGTAGTILQTRDGGKTWIRQQLNLPATGGKVPAAVTRDLFTLHFTPDGLRGWVSGEAGILAVTANSGLQWQVGQLSGREDLRALYFAGDNRTGWLAGTRGAIYQTLDGGATWQRQEADTHETLLAIRFAADKLHGWAAGDGGTLLATEDGGRAWRAVPLGVSTDLEALHTDDAGSQCWVAGAGGTLFYTADRGQSWSRQLTGIPYTLAALHFFRDGKQGWAAGAYRYVLTTKDGGRSWQQCNNYRQGFAPVVIIGLIAAGLLLYSLRISRLRRRQKGTSPGSRKFIEELLVTDKPLDNETEEQLDYLWIARGIARIIRNRFTQPPLSLAVTGEWGAGKSSLLNLVARELQLQNYYPVRFNAWHHQQQEQLLAGLLENIRLQGIPPLWQPRGILFRLRLVGRRLSYILPLFISLLALTIVLSLFMAGFPNLLELIAELLTRLHALPAWLASGENWLAGTGITVLLLNAVLFLFRLFKTFRPFNAGLQGFVRNFSGRFRLAQLTGNAGFHSQFAQEFREVTKALGSHKLVIVIDDLDRCRPANVVTVLEAVNFLAASGDCIVILGLDLQRTQNCLALEFREEAAQLQQLLAAGEVPAKRQPLDYAVQYLEKLINLEIPLPPPGGNRLETLLCNAARQQNTPLTLRQWLGQRKLLLKRFAGSCAVVILSLLSCLFAGILLFFSLPAAVSRPVQPAVESLVMTMGGQSTGAQSAGAPASIPPATADVVFQILNETSPAGFYPSTYRATLPRFASIGMFVMLATLLLILWLEMFFDRKQPIDSPLFRRALAAWQIRLASRATTPRAVKRLLNRLRYMAMHYSAWQQAQEEQARLAKRARRKQPGLLQPPPVAIREDDFTGLAVAFLTEPAVLQDAEGLRRYILSCNWPRFSLEGKLLGVLTKTDTAELAVIEDGRRIFQTLFCPSPPAEPTPAWQAPG